MEKNDFENELAHLRKPDTGDITHQQFLKLPIIHARQSSFWGIWLVALPAFFLFCVVMKYYFHLHLGFFDVLEETMSSLDKDPIMKWLSPVLLVIAPLLGLVMNILSVLFIAYLPEKKELQLTIKLKWLNLLIGAACLGVVCIFLLYAIVENIHHIK